MASVQQGTDLRKWKLHVDRGQQVWKYHPDQKPTEQQTYDKYFLGLDLAKDCPPLPKPKTIKDSCRNAFKFWSQLQCEDGHWGNDYGGPMFLLPGIVITSYITKTLLSNEHKIEMIRYLRNHQAADGGWGLHVESETTCFGATLNYIALRLLGVERDDPVAVKARQCIHKLGGAANCPHWGKVWMAALGVFDWEGVNAVLPELWLLPYSLPIHPGRFWCHCRVVYLPMAWLYGTKSVGPITDLVKELREEIYTEPYDRINWASKRFTVAPPDLYKPHSFLVKTVFPLLNMYDKCAPSFLRKRALDSTLEHIRYEDKQTDYIDIGPVNKPFDMLCEYFATNGQSQAFRDHQRRFYDYLWLASDGMKCQGYNGCQLWDTAFALQAMCDTGLGEEFKETVTQAFNYVDITQVRENAPQSEKFYRHISKGAWPFSTRDHGWPIADCTGEGMRAVMMAENKFSFLKKLDPSRLEDSVNVLLSYQNADGGWPTYENQRSGAFLELLNPAECFDGIMVDYSYVELSSSAMRSLLMFQQLNPTHRKDEIDRAIKRGIEYIKSIQRPDGSWHGSWAVCYTYGIWFGVEAFVACGRSDDDAVDRACQFLLQKQRPDGSWGEDFQACCKRVWVENKEGHAVHTAWALMSLMRAQRNKTDHIRAVKRGIRWLCEFQEPNGNYRQQSIVGVFNFNCAIEYLGYKNYFSFWAMGRYLNDYKYGGDCPIADLPK